VHFVVAEQNRKLVRKQGILAVAGRCRRAGVLIKAHIARALMLVAATPDSVPRARHDRDGARSIRRSHLSEAEAKPH
jgi:CPA2 family monovalent cation:H+ antiporter-2